MTKTKGERRDAQRKNRRKMRVSGRSYAVILNAIRKVVKKNG